MTENEKEILSGVQAYIENAKKDPRNWPENKMNLELEMRALDAEKAGMEAENCNRLGGAGAFFQLAERYRALKDDINQE